MRAGADVPFIVGCNDDQFALKKFDADRNYLVPPADHPEWSEVLRWIVKTERLHLIIPTVDPDVESLSRARKKLGEYLFLPSESVLDLCRDKYRLLSLLRRNGIDAPLSYPVRDLKQVTKIFQQLRGGRPLWCRVRSGAGALGALPVQTPEQARSWIRYWKEMRGVPVAAFVLSEYLPGRDFGCQSVWKDGKLVLIKTYERLSYLGMGSQPSRFSSVAALAKTVFEAKVVDTCARAIKLIDARASGVFSVDLKEDVRGIPCITEIGVGRFSSATNIFDLVGKHNMAKTFVQLARGQKVKIEDSYDAAPDWYMMRDLDGAPRIFHASQFADNIRTTWQGAASGRGRLEATGRGKSGWRTFKSTRK
jgi:carbamoyl-phosphate synthase large subunit